MSSSDRSTQLQSGALSFEFDLQHAPARVWRALTDPTLLTEWLLPVLGLELEEGRAFRFQAPPQPGWDGTVSCRLLEIDEPRRLRWSWTVGDLDTVVTFTLEPTPSGTRLLLVQSGFTPDQKRNLAGARYGWKMMGERLVDLLETLDEQR